ncbi:MAG: DUF177 domain-containing protein [Bacteroidales bacterium]|nr:DUF177 domain-containing protein [Bacteroidales bacterium]
MDKLIEYQIPHKGLSLGQHEYNFHVNDKFFVDKQIHTIDGGNLKVSFVLDKQIRFMQADIIINGTIKLVCDRCLDSFDFKIDITYNQIFKYSNSPVDQNDDIIYLGDDIYNIDVSKLIIDNILLQIPIKKVHPDDKNGNSTCKKEQLELIKEYEKKEQADPRWEALKNIKFED